VKLNRAARDAGKKVETENWYPWMTVFVVVGCGLPGAGAQGLDVKAQCMAVGERISCWVSLELEGCRPVVEELACMTGGACGGVWAEARAQWSMEAGAR
jgi:hypothetical protein